jgi:molybdate/tungstate transport system permease protein
MIALLTIVTLAALAAVHGWLLASVWPMEGAVNLALGVADAIVAANWLIRFRRAGAAASLAYFAGYAALLGLLWPLLSAMETNALVAVMALVLYAGLANRPFLTGYLFLAVVCLVYAAAFAREAFLLSALLYTGTRPLWRMWAEGENRLVPALYLLGAALLFAVLLPLAYFCSQSSPQTLAKTLQDGEVRSALWLSLWTASAATLAAAVPATALAYVLVRTEFPGRGVLHALVDVPLLIPPPVLGVALVTVFGPNTPLGRELETRLGLAFLGSVTGILGVQVFVGVPFLVRSAMIAFAGVDPHYEKVARTLGAGAWGAFARVTLPQAAGGIALGMVLMWFRAVGEFGATYIVASTPETVPILVWKRFQSFGPVESRPVAVLGVLLFLSLFAGVSLLRARLSKREGE